MSKVAIVNGGGERKTNPRQKSVRSFSGISHSTKTKEMKKVKLDRGLCGGSAGVEDTVPSVSRETALSLIGRTADQAA